MSESASPIPIIFNIDIEPDLHVFPPSDPSPWHGFENLYPQLQLLRGRLEELTGAPVSFGWTVRMDPQIAVGYGSAGYIAERYGDVLNKLVSAGDTIGLHPHAWRWEADRDVWVADHASQAWLDEVVRSSVDAYREAFGTTPPFHEFGGVQMNTATMNLVGELWASRSTSLLSRGPPHSPTDRAWAEC